MGDDIKCEEPKWSRPTTVPFPNTWRTFDGKKEINGEKRKYWIQDITEDMYEEILDYMGGQVMEDEPLAKYLKVPEDPTFVPELRPLWKEGLDEKLGIACMTLIDGKPKLVGYNALVRFDKAGLKLNPLSPTWKKMLGIIKYVTYLKCPFKHFNVDEYLGAMGLFVVRDYRGEGIALNLLQTRESMCKAFGFKLTMTFFSSIGAQSVAVKAGHDEFTTIAWADLRKLGEEYNVEGIEEHTEYVKYMSKEYK